MITWFGKIHLLKFVPFFSEFIVYLIFPCLILLAGIYHNFVF